MARNKRKAGENTNQLLSCFVTPKEKALILRVIPEGESMSSFLRHIIMMEVKLKLKRDARAKQNLEKTLDLDVSDNKNNIEKVSKEKKKIRKES